MPEAPILVDFNQPPEEAIAYLKNKGFVLDFDRTQILKEAHHKAFTVAKVARADLLYHLYTALIHAQREGLPFRAFQENLQETLKTKGWKQGLPEEKESPSGIDPGFDINPGQVRYEPAQNKDGIKLKSVEPPHKKGTKPRVSVPPKQKSTDSQKRGENTLIQKPSIVPEVFSTLTNITTHDLEASLRAIPHAQKQLEKLQQFLKIKPIKTLVLKETQMNPKGRSAQRISKEVTAYLDDRQNQLKIESYTIQNHESVHGFTDHDFNHIVLKGDVVIVGGARIKIKDGANLQEAGYSHVGKELSNLVKRALASRENNEPKAWSLSELGNQNAQIITTWVHEIGHQVHLSASTPKPPTTKRLTEYSKEDDYEYHAEHFTAWLFNRDALEGFDPKIAKHFDDLIEIAINNEKKR